MHSRIAAILGRGAVLPLVLSLVLPALPAVAETVTIQVPYYNNGMSGAVWAVAVAKGYFKDVGLDVQIRSSTGGSADIRNMMAGDLPYVESAVPAVLTASEQGADLKIVSDNAISFGSTMWFTLASSPINSLKDLKGHTLGYSHPQSSTQMLDLMLLKKLGYTQNDVKLVAAGSLGAELTLLADGGLDAVTVGDQHFYAAPPGKYKLLASVRDVLPPITNTIGVTTAKAAKEHPDVIRKLIAARRKAVQFTRDHPDEAAAIMAKAAKWNPEVTRKVVSDLAGRAFWGEGGFGKGEDMDNAIRGLKLAGVITTTIDWRRLVDQKFLPADLRTNLKAQ